MLREDNVGWSAEEDRRLAKMWCAQDPPASTREIADALDKSKSAVSRRIAALDLRGRKGDRAHYERLTGVSLEPLIRPVRISTPSRPTGEPIPNDYTVLVWGDTQYPFHDPRAISILRQISRDLSPDILVCLGDVYDFYEPGFSDHRPPAGAEPDIQDTLNLGTTHLADMLEIARPRKAYFLAGNHEDRWERLLIKARGDVRFRQLLQIPSIKKAMEFEEVVGFSELGYHYEPYMEGEPLVLEDLIVITHGHLTNKYATRSMLDAYGKSVMFGHTHRIQSFTRTDLKGQEAGWNIGCLCTLDPHYGHRADWQQGFAIITFTDGLFNVEQIRIHDGRAIWRDSLYKG